MNITTQYLFHCASNLSPIRVRNTIPSSKTRAHRNGSPTTARILPIAGHRPIPSDKPTLLPNRQAPAMATPIPLPSRIPRRLRTTTRSQRIHDRIRRIHPLLVQHPLPNSSPRKHHSTQRLPRHSQKTAHPRQTLYSGSVFSLSRNLTVLLDKLLHWRNASNSHTSTGVMGRHLHRHRSIRHVRGGIRHLHVLQTKMVVHRHRLNRSNNRRSSIHPHQAHMGHRSLPRLSHSPRHSLHDSPQRKRLHIHQNLERNP